jgi:hypothetical protein
VRFAPHSVVLIMYIINKEDLQIDQVSICSQAREVTLAPLSSNVRHLILLSGAVMYMLQ